MITIVNYGLGNVQAITNIYKRLNIPTRIADTPEALIGSEKIILPGVGAFDWAMTLLNQSGMRECLDELVLRQGRPVLGICVGMQIMARRSDEGDLNGLGWFDEEVKQFTPAADRKMYLPHMGWNDIHPLSDGALFRNIDSNGRFYFLHSYYFATENQDHVLALTDYNGLFASSVHTRNIFGVQFHPEKSHHWGIQLLKNFAEM